jgi:hypothetical protein
MRDRCYLLVTAAAADEIASSSKLLWKFLLRVIALSMCSSNVVFCYSAQSFLKQYKRVGGGGRVLEERLHSLFHVCFFGLASSIKILSTTMIILLLDYRPRASLYQLLLNLSKPVRASLAPLFLHPKEAQDYISRALPLSSPKYQIRSLLLIHLQFQT